jgi:hypothetical protein
MLTLNEYKEIKEAVQSLDLQFTDDVIDKAEYYNIEEDEVEMQTIVTVYDANGGVLVTANVEDYDMAVAYMEDMFDLESSNPEEANDDAAAGNSRYGHA